MNYDITKTTHTKQNDIGIIENAREFILLNWFHEIRKSVSIKIPDVVLMTWLDKCYIAFSDPSECNEGLDDKCIFSEFSTALLSSGVDLSDIITIVNLFQDATDTYVKNSSTDIQSTHLSGLARQFISLNISKFINKQANDLNRERDKIASLLRVAQAASSSLALEDVLKVISEEVVRVLDAYGCNAFLFPERSKHGYYCLIDPLPPPDYKVPDPPDQFTMEALIEKKPITCYDAMLDPRTDKRTMKFFGLKSLIAFPLIFQGKAVAAGFCCMKDYHHFTQEEIDTVMGIANSGAVAVENARLSENNIQLATARERNRLAQEMHDGLAQALAGIKLKLNSILAEDLSESAQCDLLEIKNIVDETYKDIRDTIFGLRAINNLDTDFLDNFTSYLRTFGIHNNLDISVSIQDEHLTILTKDVLLQIGRILEEALTNIKKHANARHVCIESGRKEDKIWFSIRDDGIGFLVSSSKNQNQNHFGIPIMHERAESVGGTVIIDQVESGGTCVRVEIPINYA